jgi:hypothetical protein
VPILNAYFPSAILACEPAAVAPVRHPGRLLTTP